MISLARALSFNGLAQRVPHRRDQRRPPRRAAVRRAARCSPGRRCWRRPSCRARTDVGALRLRTIATKDRPCARLSAQEPATDYDPAVILDLDYWVLMPLRSTTGDLLRAPRAYDPPAAAHKAAAPRSRARRSSVRAAPRDRSADHGLIAIALRGPRAVVSGTMPTPTLHSTSRQTASKLRSCTRSLSGRPMRLALSARKR